MQVTPTVGPGSIHQPSINHIGTHIFKSENWILAPLLLLLGWWWWRGVSPVFMFPGPHPPSSPHNHNCTVLYCTVVLCLLVPILILTSQSQQNSGSSLLLPYRTLTYHRATQVFHLDDSLIDSDEALFVVRFLSVTGTVLQQPAVSCE